MEDMIGLVDAVLLARDYPENHKVMAKPFLDADVPIFIDKPLAITTDDLNYFTEQHNIGKFLMSCSSMRYAAESEAVKPVLSSLGKIELATAVGKKDWIKYGYNQACDDWQKYHNSLIEGITKTDIEIICEQVHKAYCKYHKERTEKDYWTKGDYSLLKEDGKEYDRRTVRVVIAYITKKLRGEDR